jgi:hypothetical protein
LLELLSLDVLLVELLFEELDGDVLVLLEELLFKLPKTSLKTFPVLRVSLRLLDGVL